MFSNEGNEEIAGHGWVSKRMARNRRPSIVVHFDYAVDDALQAKGRIGVLLSFPCFRPRRSGPRVAVDFKTWILIIYFVLRR